MTENFNFDLNQQFNEKINSLKKFDSLYNDDQTVTDVKITNLGGSDKLNLKTAAYNSGFRQARIGGGNNDSKTEPYIITKVRPTEGANFFTQFNKAGRDFIRITKYLSSNAGLLFFAKQNLLGINGRPNPLGKPGVSLTEKPTVLEKKLLGKSGKLARNLPLAQKYKPFYLQTSTLANVAAGAIGVQGSRVIRFDRDFPVKSGGLFGGTNLNYTDNARKPETTSQYQNDRVENQYC